MAHFLACKKTNDALNVVNLFLGKLFAYMAYLRALFEIGMSNSWATFDAPCVKFSTSHPQTDSQTEVTNRTLGNLLRCLSGDIPHQWDLNLAWEEFDLNNMTNQSTSKSPFEIVYTQVPHLTLDLAHLLVPVDLSAEATLMADRIKKSIKKSANT